VPAVAAGSVAVVMFGFRMKVAVTDFAASMTTVQTLPARELQPAQLPKLLPVLGVAVNCTVAPLVNCAVQLTPQLMPPVFEVTVPAPLFATVSMKLGTVTVKLLLLSLV